MDRLDELEGTPKTRDGAVRRAREDPARFNDLVDAGAIAADVFATDKEEDQR